MKTAVPFDFEPNDRKQCGYRPRQQFDQALRALKKKMQREGIFREMKMRDTMRSQKRAREKAEAVLGSVLAASVHSAKA